VQRRISFQNKKQTNKQTERREKTIIQRNEELYVINEILVMPMGFSNATSCSLQDGQQHFVGICCVYIQGLPFYPEDEDINQLHGISTQKYPFSALFESPILQR